MTIISNIGTLIQITPKELNALYSKTISELKMFFDIFLAKNVRGVFHRYPVTESSNWYLYM